MKFKTLKEIGISIEVFSFSQLKFQARNYHKDTLYN